jgi:hypothetical protein
VKEQSSRDRRLASIIAFMDDVMEILNHIDGRVGGNNEAPHHPTCTSSFFSFFFYISGYFFMPIVSM